MVKNKLPDSSRVWIYQSDIKFTADQIKLVNAKLEDFVISWEAHGASLSAAAEVLLDHFIVIFVDEGAQAPTGCSIDKSVALIKSIETEFGIDLMNRMNIAYKSAGKVVIKKMPEFQADVRSGLIDQDTVVYNNLVQRKGEFMSDWEGPLKGSWHKQLL